MLNLIDKIGFFANALFLKNFCNIVNRGHFGYSHLNAVRLCALFYKHNRKRLVARLVIKGIKTILKFAVVMLKLCVNPEKHRYCNRAALL